MWYICSIVILLLQQVEVSYPAGPTGPNVPRLVAHPVLFTGPERETAQVLWAIPSLEVNVVMEPI